MQQLKDDFWIGEWHIQPSLNRVTGMAHVVQLEPRIMGVLLRLAEEPGTVVTREALLAAVWPDVIVGDDPLNRAISELRKVFQDNPRQPAFIETIRTVGYRLIAPVSTHRDALPTVSVPLEPTLGDGMPEEVPVTLAPEAHRFVWVGVVGIVVILGAMLLLSLFTNTPPPGRDAWRPVPFTSLPGKEMDPAFSHDGSRVAFAWEGLDQNNVDIYVRLLDEETPMRLTSDAARETSPAWSPDNQYLAFVRRTATTCGLYQVPALGGLERKLADCAATDDITWSPDGAWIAFADKPQPAAPYSIYLLATQSLEVRRLTTPPTATVGDRFPAFSPDGQSLAFVRSSVTGLDYIYTLPTSGGSGQRLTQTNQRLNDLTWPLPGTLFYSSDWSGTISLYEWSIQEETATWLTTSGESVHHPTYSASPQRLVYEEWRWTKNIWAAPLGEAAAQPYALNALMSTRWDRSPQVSPEGDRIVFVSNRSGSYEIMMWDSTANRVAALTDFGGPNLDRPRWSPDGRALAFDVRSDGNADIYLLASDGGLPQRFTTHTAHDVAPSWSRDGRHVYFASDRSGVWEVWQKPLNGADARQVTTQGGYAAMESPDGQYLYYTKATAHGLWRKRIYGDAETLITDRLDMNDWGNWAITQDGLYFVDRTTPPHTDLGGAEASAALAFLDFATGDLTLLAYPNKPVANPGLAVAPDGSYLLYIQIDHSESDLMMLE